MSKKQNHVHKLQKHVYKSKTEIFFCVLDCSYKIDCALALGKQTICHECGNEFTLNEVSIKLKRPHCPDCGMKVVLDEDGKKRRISKRLVNKPAVLASMAEDSAQSLSNRLKASISSQLTTEEDI